jgi:hypothetical protein
MCFALFIAVGSFIAIPERVAALLPDVFATPVMRGFAVGLVFFAMFYWLWRIRGREFLARLPHRSATEPAATS